MLKPGIGTRMPTAQERVTVHYTGWTTDGKMFDSSVSRGTPTTFRLDGVIAGWTEGVALMVEGERTRFWIPQDLAYKGEGRRPARHARVRYRADSNRTLVPQTSAETRDAESYEEFGYLRFALRARIHNLLRASASPRSGASNKRGDLFL